MPCPVQRLLAAEVVGNRGRLWQLLVYSTAFAGLNGAGDGNWGGQKRKKGGGCVLLDGDVPFPATGKAGCCLNASIPVAVLISEMKN